MQSRLVKLGFKKIYPEDIMLLHLSATVCKLLTDKGYALVHATEFWVDHGSHVMERAEISYQPVHCPAWTLDDFCRTFSYEVCKCGKAFVFVHLQSSEGMIRSDVNDACLELILNRT